MSRAHVYEDEFPETYYGSRRYRVPRSHRGMLQIFPKGRESENLVIYGANGDMGIFLKDGIAARAYACIKLGKYADKGYISQAEKQKIMATIQKRMVGKSSEEITDIVIGIIRKTRNTDSFRQKVFNLSD